MLLPLLLLLAFRGSSRKEWRNRLKVALAYVAVAVVYLAVRSMVLHNLLGTTSWSAPWSQVLATAPFAMVFYLRKLVIPTGLSPFYMIGLQTKASPQVWLTAVAILLGIALVAWRRSAWRVAASLILLPLVPAIAGIHFFYGTGLIEHTETVHDRYLYLPSVGLALILALLAKYLWSRSRNVSLVLGLLLIVACIGLNVTQQDFYRSEASLFTHVFKGAGVRPEELGTYMLVAAGTACKTGLPEEARELLNVDRLALVRRDGIVISGIVSFQGTLGDRSFEFDAQDGNIKYLTPQMVLRTVPSADVALDLTACLNYPVMPNR